MTINAFEAQVGEQRAAHREQCFDAIKRALGLGDTKGDTGLWLDWIDAVAPGHTADEVITLTLEQLRREYGTTATMNPPVNWTAAGWNKMRPTTGPWMARFAETKAYSGLPQSGTCSIENDRKTRIVAHLVISGNEDKANAHLIAAAPDLLEVARYILACYDQEVARIQRPGSQADIDRLAGTIAGCHINIGINVDAFADNIRTAVAKAEGR